MGEKKGVKQKPLNKNAKLSFKSDWVCVSFLRGGRVNYLFMYSGRTVGSPVRNSSMRYGRASGGECPWLLLLFILSILDPPSSRPYLQGGHSRRHRLRAGERARQEDLELILFRVMNSREFFGIYHAVTCARNGSLGTSGGCAISTPFILLYEI